MGIQRTAFLRRTANVSKEIVSSLLGDDLTDKQTKMVMDSLSLIEKFEDSINKEPKPEPEPDPKELNEDGGSEMTILERAKARLNK
jgi:hypothetical protein